MRLYHCLVNFLIRRKVSLYAILQDRQGVESEYDISSHLAEFDQARRTSPVDYPSRPWQSADGSVTQTEEFATPGNTLSLASCSSHLNDEAYGSIAAQLYEESRNQIQGNYLARNNKYGFSLRPIYVYAFTLL